MIIIETDRLILRTWEKKDSEIYFLINQDSKVTEYLPCSLTMKEVNAFISGANIHNDKYGYTLWATEFRETNELIGFVGLNYTDWKSHFTPAVEIGWRLGSKYWGQGLATEGAKTALDYGFKQCDIKEIVSFTVPANIRSIRVMDKIGLKRDFNGDFTHPKLDKDHPLSRHILYRLSKNDYLK